MIEDPIREAEKLRSIMDLPAPNTSNLLDFKALKAGQAQYGSGRGFLSDENKIKNLAQKTSDGGKQEVGKMKCPKN